MPEASEENLFENVDGHKQKLSILQSTRKPLAEGS